MSDADIIRQAIKKAQNQLLLHLMWTSLWKGLVWGGLIALIWIIAFKLLPLDLKIWDVGFKLAALAALAVSWIQVLRHRPNFKSAAIYLDQKKKLDERLSTFLEMSQKPTASPWQTLLQQDAVRSLQKVDWKNLVAWKFPVPGRWAVLLMIACSGLAFVPEYRTQAFRDEQTAQEIVQDHGKELVKLLTQTYENRPKAIAPDQADLIQQAIDLGKQMENASLKKAGALRKLEDFESQAQEQLDKLKSDPSQDRLKELAASKGVKSKSSAKEASDKMQDLRDSLGELAGKADKLAELQTRLDAIKNQAGSMKDDLGDPTSAVSQAMQAALEEMREQMEELGMSEENINTALKALKDGKAEEFEENLDFATQDLQKLMDMAQALNKMEQELGDNLKEQLERGQIPMAIQSLQQMQEKLQDPSLTPEEKKAMLEELKAAAQAVSDFPQLSEALKQATRNMEKNDHPAAEENLADAAQQLADILNDIQNAESLQQMKDPWQKPRRESMAVKNGVKWAKRDLLDEAEETGIKVNLVEALALGEMTIRMPCRIINLNWRTCPG
ncbi:MAG: hypothetical protein LR011_04770 [Verrucomicrobia bacterium]|nr:hypothetical protein [Verrucomicrobiota bacterium]